MANAIYDNHWLAQYGDPSGVHGVVDFEADTFRVYLVDTGTYTFSAAHADVADLSGIEETSGNLTDFTTAVTAGVLTVDAGDITFSSVTGGTSIEAFVLAKWSGSAATSPLIAYVDTGVTGLPVTPGSGDDVVLAFHANGVLTIGT